MDIKLTFQRDFTAWLQIGDFKLRGMKPIRKEDGPYYTHPFPYTATIWLPEDRKERSAIYSFVTENYERIKSEYGLVFEFYDVNAIGYSAYEKEFNILGLDRRIQYTQDQLKNRFRELCLTWHPDRWIGHTEDEIKYAEEKFKEIKMSYEAIIQTEARMDFEVAVYCKVTDLKAKHMYDLYESEVEEQKNNRIASLKF